MSNLANKRYIKPRANQVIDPNTAPHIMMAADLVEMKNWTSVVLPECREKGAYNPSRSFFAISDPRPLSVGDKILVDTYGGYSELTYVSKKDGRMIEVSPRFVNVPKLLGEVYKIIGEKTTLIDSTYDLSKEEDMHRYEVEQKEWENLKIAKRTK